MNGKLERIQKESFKPSLRYCTDVCLKGQKKTPKKTGIVGGGGLESN
jgi:hypothetical protein